MKKLLFLAAAFVTSIAAMAQPKATDVVKSDVSTYDFGKIKQNVPVTVYFTLTNTSDKPAVIENAWAGCGCTTPEYSKGPIAPGASAKIKVGYNAAAMGRFEKDVNIKLAGVNDAMVIRISGEVVDEAAFTTYSQTPEYKKSQKARADKLTKDEKAFKAQQTSK